MKTLILQNPTISIAYRIIYGGGKMSNTDNLDEEKEPIIDKPGLILATHRMELNYSIEYIAEKLHLRARIIELLENDDYFNMPEPVFIKGYLRAYAKLLGISAEPLLETFNKIHGTEKKLERALWQSKRQSNKAERAIRFVTTGFVLLVLVAVIIWWRGNKENEHIFSANFQTLEKPSNPDNENEIRLTDLSKMRSLLSSGNDFTQEQVSD